MNNKKVLTSKPIASISYWNTTENKHGLLFDNGIEMINGAEARCKAEAEGASEMVHIKATQLSLLSSLF